MTESRSLLIAAAKLQKFAAEILQGGGFAAEEAEITAKSLVLADLLGHPSHGVIRVIEYTSFLYKGLVKSGAELTVLKDETSSLLADGNLGLGQVQMPRFLDRLIAKTAEYGTVAGSMRNCGHTGRLGEWAEYLAAKKLACFLAVNDNGAIRCVAPPGGKTPFSSTNPLAFGIPLKDGEYFTIDMATSAAAIGKIRLAHLSDSPVAEGLIQDADGHDTTDPAVMFAEPAGALKTFGSYKGFALSMMMDCLAAGLSGGFMPPAPDDAPPVNCITVTIWNPESFAGLAHMQEEAEKYLDFIRSIPPRDPKNPVRVPGDRAKSEYQKNLENGIPLSRGTAEALVKRAEKFGITLPPVFI
ncbi:MAG: Ldh family oxidoreductase [Micavibrio sp.]|nr:MAG: Ldh family oxidoreductase [Micavibrio sp.]